MRLVTIFAWQKPSTKEASVQIFRIDEDDRNQFARVPEIAMDLTFGRSGSNFYLVMSCSMAVLLDETTFTVPEASFFTSAETAGLSPDVRTRDFMPWFNDLPALSDVRTATPLQAWSSFMGAVGPVTPISRLPSPPPAPPSIYGHLPFKAKTLPGTVFYRWEAYPTSRRIDLAAKTIAKDTYAAPASEVPFAPTGFAAVARFALPSLMPACYRYELQPVSNTDIECGASVPLYGQSGGGVEVKFVAQASNRGAIANPVVLPAL
jgi:hypothetical protein